MTTEHLASCFCGACTLEDIEHAEFGDLFEFSDDTAKEIAEEICSREAKAALSGLVIGAVLGAIIAATACGMLALVLGGE